jgi:hypothetical protein
MKTFNVPQFYNGFCCYFKSICFSFDKVFKLFILSCWHPTTKLKIIWKFPSYIEIHKISHGTTKLEMTWKFTRLVKVKWALSNMLMSSLFNVVPCRVDDALPSSWINSNMSLKWKQRKSKELGHVPWLATLWG